MYTSAHPQDESASPAGGTEPSSQPMEQELLGDTLQTTNRDEYDNHNWIHLMASTGTEELRGTQHSITHGEKTWKTLVIHTCLWLMLVSYLGQIGIYMLSTLRCSYPSLSGFNDPLRLMIVSDMHLLGHRRKSYLQRLWVNWQLSMALQLNIRYYQPQVLILLGDQFDEGGPPTAQRLWDVYARRLDAMLEASIFSIKSPQLVYVLGNHDSGWGGPRDVGRYERSFGKVNEVLEIESETFIKIDAVILADAKLAKVDSASSPGAQLYNDTLAFINEQGSTGRLNSHPPILLSHIPLYRPNDVNCGPHRVNRGHVTFEAPEMPYVVGSDVLPREISHHILSTLKPGMVLSGHTHAYCHTRHNQTNVTEVTLSTFGWGMRPDPSFGLALVKHGKMNVHPCALPNESQIFLFYGLALVLLLVYLGMNRRNSIKKSLKIN